MTTRAAAAHPIIMGVSILFAVTLGLSAAPAFGWQSFGAQSSDRNACQSALSAAARRHGVPESWALAIGFTEAGRRLEGGAPAIWPWTLNIAGEGRYYRTRGDAAAALRAALGDGETSIDIGCAQINWHWHRDTAGATAPDLLAPAANADYAMRFLAELKRQQGDWRAAVARFHSADPVRGSAYLDRVARNRDRIAALGMGRGTGAAPRAIIDRTDSIRSIDLFRRQKDRAGSRAANGAMRSSGGGIALWSRLEHTSFALPTYEATDAVPFRR